MACIKGITQLYLPPTRLSMNGMRHPAFTPSHSASPHSGRYSFPIPHRVGGWVGLGGWSYRGTMPTQRWSLLQYQPTDSAAAGDRTHAHWITSLTP